VLQRVSCATQRHAITTLDRMDHDVRSQGLGSPAVIVLGEAVAHRQIDVADITMEMPYARAI
jgi:uroporphyrin-III C-methyltransferase